MLLYTLGNESASTCTLNQPFKNSCQNAFWIIYFCYFNSVHSTLFSSRFLYVDVGSNGRISDGGVWRECTLNRRLESHTAGLPADAPLTPHSEALPYVFVADEAFPLHSYLMKPYAR